MSACRYVMFVYKAESETNYNLWVPIGSTSKISWNDIRDLVFKPRLHKVWQGLGLFFCNIYK